MRTVLHHCSVVDCTGSAPIPDAALIVENKQIVAVGHRAQVWPEGSASDGATLLDMQGGYVLPGLMDLHVHLSLTYPLHSKIPGWEEILPWVIQKRAQDALEAGVTLIRTCGEDGHYDIRLRKAIDAGWTTGPRMVCAGRGITPTGGHGSESSWYIEADGPDDFRRKAREQIKAGADCIKLMVTGGIADPAHLRGLPRITREEARAAVETAHEYGKHVVAHIGGPEAAKMAVEVGIDCLEHCYTLDDEAVEMMGEAHAFIGGTLCVTNAHEWMRENGTSEQRMVNMRAAGKEHLDWFARAVHSGARPVASTDHIPTMRPNIPAFPVAAIHEIQLMVRAGLSTMQALQSATKNAAALCGLSKTLGTLEKGKLADIIAVAGNPVADITNLGDVRFVMKDGAVVRNSWVA